MKKLLLPFLIFLSFSISAQEYSFPYKNVLRLAPFEFGRAEFQLNYERYFNNRKSSLVIAPSLFLKDGEEESRNGWQLMSQYRFYLTHLTKEEGKSFLGIYDIAFYSGLYALYMNLEDKNVEGYYDDSTGEYIEQSNIKNISAQEGGALLGMQVDITTRIVFDFYVGGGIRYSQVEETATIPKDYRSSPSIFEVEYQGVKPKIGFSLGMTF